MFEHYSHCTDCSNINNVFMEITPISYIYILIRRSTHVSNYNSKKKILEHKFIAYHILDKSAKWHCGRHTLICKKILIKKT